MEPCNTSYPKVSCITPTTHDRGVFNHRILNIFDSQDYANKEHLFCYDDLSIGEKRNKLCELSTGEIILMMDSDDYFAPDFITRSVAHLISSGADCTGLCRAYFYQSPSNLWLYEYSGNQPYCIGSSMMFYKRVWEVNKFKAISTGEDAKFCANAGRVKPHNYIEGFMAMIHGKNTASHKQLAHMKRVDPQIAKEILGGDWEKY